MGVILLMVVAAVLIGALRNPDSIDVREFITLDAEYKNNN